MHRQVPFSARPPWTTFVACFALALAACAVLWLAYPYAILAPDTHGYTRLARILTGEAWTADAAQAVGLPLFLTMILPLGEPAVALLWLNALAFSAAMGLCAWVVQMTFGSARLAMLGGTFLILLEFMLMEPFFSIAFALPDLLLCVFLTAGTLLAYGWWATRSTPMLLAAGLLLGMSDLFRPLHVTLLAWGCIACAFLLFGKKHIPRPYVAGFLTLLLAPTFLWATWHRFAYPNTDGIPSLHLSTHAMDLWSPEDALFDDPAVNAAFFRTIDLPDARVPDLPPSAFGHDPASIYGRIYGFIGSQTDVYRSGTGSFALYKQQSADIAWTISARTILLHPFGYALNVARNYLLMLNPYQLHSWPLEFFAPDARHAYEKMKNSRYISPDLRRLYFGPTGEPDPSRLHANLTSPVLAAVRAADLRTLTAKFGVLLPLLEHLFGLLGVLLLFSPRFSSALHWPRSRVLLAGALLLILFLTISTYAGAIAIVTSHNQSRYAIPYLLCLHLLLLSGAIVAARYAEHFFERLFLHAE